MTQKGSHTWDLLIEYLACPQCGKIIENRKSYAYEKGNYKKEVQCDRCTHSFTVTKLTRSSDKPLIGTPQPPQMDWGSGD